MKDILRVFHILRICRCFRDGFFYFLDRIADMIKLTLRRHSQNIDKTRIRKILAIRIDRIGDLILTTPALRAIKETYPESFLAVLVRRYTKDIIAGLPFIDEVIVLEEHKADELVDYLRNLKFDVSLGFHPDILVNSLPCRAGIPFRIGYGFRGTGIFLNVSLSDDRLRRVRHEVESALEVTAKINAKPKDKALSIAVHNKSEIFAERFFRENELVSGPVVAIHPGSRQEYIRWSKERFAQVADRLAQEKKVKILLLGSSDEAGLVNEVRSLMKEKSTVAVNLKLADLISVIKRCSLFIGNSTGPMHIAAALKVPVVAIFGNIHPKDSFQEWGPWGSGNIIINKDLGCLDCHPGDCPDYLCYSAVTVEDVFGAVIGLLKT
jgi:ADP-heptose:LPS heptosyltransferase